MAGGSILAPALYGERFSFDDDERVDKIAVVDDASGGSDEEAQSAVVAGLREIDRQKVCEASNDIKYRTCSWQKTAALLFSEYICLAIMSFPWSYSVLGLVPGLILTFTVATSVLYTSLILWRYCLRHPEVRDVCDIGQKLFGGKRWAWYATAVCFLLNNTFIQALHCLVGGKYLNTMSGHSMCTIWFSAIIAAVSFVLSLPRTFATLSHAATFSAITMFVSVILGIAFAGAQDYPANYDRQIPIVWTVFPEKGTTYILGMSAFMNIAYTFIGQITLPSFIAEMEDPRDFPKALWAVTISEIVIFSLAGSLIYIYTGNAYMTAPAYGSIGWHGDVGKKIAYTFALPTIVFLGILYASVSARFLFFRLFRSSRHMHSNTVTAWAVWTGLLALTWILAFVVAEVIPFFSDLLSLMCALFDSFFGFIFWGIAWMRMRQEDGKSFRWREMPWAARGGMVLNGALIMAGTYFLTAGTYSVVQSIVDNYRANLYGGVFSCADNSL